MAPRNPLDEAGMRKHFREERVPGKSVGLGVFASVYVWFAGVACGVNEKGGFILAQIIEQQDIVGDRIGAVAPVEPAFKQPGQMSLPLKAHILVRRYCCS